MTRRAALWAVAGSYGLSHSGCIVSDDRVHSVIQELLDRCDLAILRRDARTAFTTRRTVAGRLPLAERTEQIRVSPDARVVVWSPKRHGVANFDKLEFLGVTSAKNGTTFVRFPGHWAYAYVSSFEAAKIFAVSVAYQSGERWLLAFSRTSFGPESDLTGLVGTFPLEEVMGMSVSGLGAIVALGTRDSILVINVPLGRVITTARGWRPSLSPDGEFVAFTTSDHNLVVRKLSSGKDMTLLNGLVRVYGAGAWSPEGRFLLAGAFTSPSINMRLLGIEVPENRACVLEELGEGDDGSANEWISRKLLSPG
jgi:hypothetical protein